MSAASTTLRIKKRHLRHRHESWDDIMRQQPRHVHLHESLQLEPLVHTAERVSHHEHAPSHLLEEVSNELQHSMADVIKAREELSLKYTEVYTTSVTQKHVVPGDMIFVTADPDEPTVLAILQDFC